VHTREPWAAGSTRLDGAVAAQARAPLHTGRTGRAEVGGDGDTCAEPLSVLVHVNASSPRMLIFGAVDFAAPLSRAGSFLGYRVTVCAARPVFATPTRFPMPTRSSSTGRTATWTAPKWTPVRPSAS
jgi:xanthine dehydrogenase accessory factor